MATSISLAVLSVECLPRPAKTDGVCSQGRGPACDFAALIEGIDLSPSAGPHDGPEADGASDNDGPSAADEDPTNVGTLPFASAWIAVQAVEDARPIDVLGRAGDAPAPGREGDANPPQRLQVADARRGLGAIDVLGRAGDASEPDREDDANSPQRPEEADVSRGLGAIDVLRAPMGSEPISETATRLEANLPRAAGAPMGSEPISETATRLEVNLPRAAGAGSLGSSAASHAPLRMWSGEPTVSESSRMRRAATAAGVSVSPGSARPDAGPSSGAPVRTATGAPSVSGDPIQGPPDEARAAATAELARALSQQPSAAAPLAITSPAPTDDLGGCHELRSAPVRGDETTALPGADRVSLGLATPWTGSGATDSAGHGQPDTRGEGFGGRPPWSRLGGLGPLAFPTVAPPFTIPDLSAAVGRAADVPAREPVAPDAPQFPQQIVRAVHMQWRQGIGEARLQLHPSHLGHVTVSLRVEGGHVTAVLRTESQRALERIEAHQDELRSALEQQGLRLDRIVVAADPDARGRRQAPDSTPGKHRDSGQAEGQTPFALDDSAPG